MLQRQNINFHINSRFTPATYLKIRTYDLLPSITTQKGISKKLQPLRKGPYQIIDRTTDVAYKLTDLNKKEIVQHRNNLLPYYPKEYAFRELIQLYFFIGFKVIHNSLDQNQNQSTDMHPIQKQLDKKDRISQTNIKKRRQQKDTSNRKKKSKIRRKNYTTRSKRKISS